METFLFLSNTQDPNDCFFYSARFNCLLTVEKEKMALAHFFKKKGLEFSFDNKNQPGLIFLSTENSKKEAIRSIEQQKKFDFKNVLGNCQFNLEPELLIVIGSYYLFGYPPWSLSFCEIMFLRD